MPPAEWPFRWSAKAGRYVRADGRFVSQKEVRRVIDRALDTEDARVRRLAQSLRRGTINLGEWREQMRDSIKTVHTYSAAAAQGGWARVTQADYGRIGALLKQEYLYLERFTFQIATGTQSLDTVASRAAEYVQAGRATYHQVERASMKKAGYRQEKNVLRPADHCGGCIAERDRGWVPIGTLIPIGSRTCRRNCRCSLKYRR